MSFDKSCARRAVAFGVFDVFHVGHLRYLEYAAQRCRQLWVGIRSDQLQTPGKNHGTVFTEKQRCELVAALRCVDHAFVFSVPLDDHPYWLDWFNRHDVDVVIVGGDWHGSERWNRLTPRLKEADIDVIFAPRTPGISSSKIRKTLFNL